MTRVSENSSVHAINYAVGKAKGKVEDLQLKGSTMKRLNKPSDDPVGNVELMSIRSRDVDAEQYKRSLSFAQTNLSFTENVLEEITDILAKAKELAVGQASSIYGPEIRAGVAKEIHQLRQQVLNLANKRIGNRYIFSGQKTLTRPFDENGKYHGDQNKISVEINKDVFIPVNLPGKNIFFASVDKSKPLEKSQLDLAPDQSNPANATQRNPASVNEEVEVSIFDELRALENALITDNPQLVQGLLERFDQSLERIVAARTEIGALSNSVSNNESNIEKTKLLNSARKSQIEDADVTELFGELQKEKNVLQATYKASSNLMNTSLMDFLK